MASRGGREGSAHRAAGSITLVVHSHRHEGEPDAHLTAAYSDLWHATPSSMDWAPADLTGA